MALDKQIHLYSIDTSKFYDDAEEAISRKKIRSSYLANNIKKRYKKLEDSNGNPKKDEYITEIARLKKWHKLISGYKSEKSNLLKEEVLKKSQDNIDNKKMRVLDYRDSHKENYMVSEFTSSMTRAFGLKENEPTDDIIIVRIYFVEIFKDLLKNGFMYNGDRYIYFSSSAGQIRTKKAVFVKEEKWKSSMNRITCGLSEEIINQHGGCNTNKFLAYLSLSNSATDTWQSVFNKEFDISKCIVVDDFETMVKTTYDHVSSEDFSINRVEMESMIPHMDGCGIVDTSICDKNFMVRMPWVKGLLASFDFKRFIEENNCSSKVTDIYGKEYDVLDDDIKIILTKSQFKMYKYYKSWDDYIDCFNLYNCECGVCNMESSNISNSRINYQMLQTLTDISKKEIIEILKPSNANIKKLSTDFKHMLSAFGVNGQGEVSDCKSNLQNALSLYPELMNDSYTKDTLYDIKKSLIRRYKGGKLEINGKYIFIIPDLYAFCEWLFLKNENPNGLLNNGEVSCLSYKDKTKLDLLRAPHLYREHAIRKNVYSCNEDCRSWFNTNAVYVSIHDPISKILVFDVDGDKSLVVADDLFVKIAERNMKGIVPLLYDLKKANPEIINEDSKYIGLTNAFKANIGNISNNITKVWNSGEVGEEKLQIIKWLCALNNAEIDYAKTLWRPSIPKDKANLLKEYTKEKVPYFFKWAKNKEVGDVNKSVENTTMSNIYSSIKDVRLDFKTLPNLEPINYEIMMHDDRTEINNDVTELYCKLSRRYGYKLSNTSNKNEGDLQSCIYLIKESFYKLGYNDIEISDILTKYLYGREDGLTKGKQIYWYVYGEYVVKNIQENLDDDTDVCMSCGKRTSKTEIKSHKCKECREEIKSTGMKNIVCVDCGETFEIISKGSRRTRCDTCYDKHRQKQNQEKALKYYHKTHTLPIQN